MDYTKRLNELRQHLATLPCDALLIEHPTHLLYLTGMEVSIGKVVVSQQEACLIVDGRYFEKCCQQTLYRTILSEESALKNWLAEQNIKTVGFDPDKLSYQGFLLLSQSLAPAIAVTPVESPVQKMRLIKDAEEIICLKQAARLGYEGYEYIVSLLQAGITETELAFELEFFWKKRGGKKLAFDPIIAFGANGSMPHYRAGSTRLQSNTSVLIDIGVVLHHYHSDMTRVVYFGTPPTEIQMIYAIVKEAKQRAMELCHPGTLVGELDQTARSFIASKGYGDYFTHSLGHGVGLDIHEPPTLRSHGSFSTQPLQTGMVITIEPGIYLSGIGGVRLEDTILITETGYENLTEPQ